jgi:hypothetical protein
VVLESSALGHVCHDCNSIQPAMIPHHMAPEAPLLTQERVTGNRQNCVSALLGRALTCLPREAARRCPLTEKSLSSVLFCVRQSLCVAQVGLKLLDPVL